MRKVSCIALLAALAAPLTTSSARADNPVDDFSFELKEYTGEQSAAWVVQKLVKWNLGKKCLAKLSDKEQGVLHMASFYSRDIMQYAKTVTGDDWSGIEGQSTGDKESNRKLVEPMIDAFKAKHMVTVTVEGDDCNAKDGLWFRYWGQIATTLKNYPPKSGKAFVTLNVTSKAKDVTVTVDKTGSTFTITAPRDIEVAAWDDKIDKPFRKVAKAK
ncbi:MAG TPA: hypothetical protein VFQ53_34390 [Kofleriaceae bacterium]|nr:hypothetical protein [Kofleriaceae bacterium]